MGQLKHVVLISALAAASLAAVGCQQKNTGDQTGQADTQPSKSAMQSPPAQIANNDQGSSTAAGPGTASAAVDDTMITAKVKAALLAEPGLKSTQIDVNTKDATVTLSGDVDTAAMRDKAKQIAMSTQGVKDVVDNMNLKSTS